MGVFSVNFVVKHAITPYIMPMAVPPRELTKNAAPPSTKSTTSILAEPISDRVENKLYRTTDTASFSRDSPKTIMYNMSLT